MKIAVLFCLFVLATLSTTPATRAQLTNPFDNRPTGPTGSDGVLQSRIVEAERLAGERGYGIRTGMADSKPLRQGARDTVTQLIGGSKPFIFVLTCDGSCGNLDVAAKIAESGEPIKVTLTDDGHLAYLEVSKRELVRVEISTSIGNCSRASCIYYIAAYEKF